MWARNTPRRRVARGTVSPTRGASVGSCVAGGGWPPKGIQRLVKEEVLSGGFFRRLVLSQDGVQGFTRRVVAKDPLRDFVESFLHVIGFAVHEFFHLGSRTHGRPPGPTYLLSSIARAQPHETHGPSTSCGPARPSRPGKIYTLLMPVHARRRENNPFPRFPHRKSKQSGPRCLCKMVS